MRGWEKANGKVINKILAETQEKTVFHLVVAFVWGKRTDVRGFIYQDGKSAEV